MKIEFAPIGIIHSPFMESEGMPIQPTGAAGVKGTVEVFEDFHSGLKDLGGFSHIILLYYFHRSHGFTSTLCLSWIRSRGDYLPPVRPSVRTQSGFPLFSWTRSKTACCTSRPLTFLTAPLFWTSNLMFLNSMLKCKHGQAGLAKPGKPFQAGNRMIDSNRTANKPMHATRYPFN